MDRTLWQNRGWDGGGGAEAASPVNRPLEPGARVARLVLVPEMYPYAHLKHLRVRDNGIGALIIAQRELVDA